MRRFLYQRRSSGTAGVRARGIWLQYRGRPVYLLGTDGDFLYGSDAPAAGTSVDEYRATWKRFFEEVAGYSVNLVRFSPWWFCWESAAPDWAYPFATQSGSAGHSLRYDFDRPEPRFFDTIAAICREAHRRDVLVLLTLWDDCSLSPGGVEGGPWLRHPLSALCGGPCPHPADFYNLQIEENRRIQEEFSRRVFTAVRDCPNVIIDACSEIGASLRGRGGPVRAWLTDQLARARREAPGHLLGVSGSSWSVDGGSAEEFWDEGDLDLLLPREMDGRRALYREETSRQFRFYHRQGLDKPRVVGDVSFSGVGGIDDARRHLWVALASGGHVLNARPTSFPATRLWESCRAIGQFLNGSGIRWWMMAPQENPFTPDPESVYTLGDPHGGEYLIYFLDRPARPLQWESPEKFADARLAWIDTEYGRVTHEEHSDGSGTLTAPRGTGDVALWIRTQADALRPEME